jgi:hypothetical protein
VPSCVCACGEAEHTQGVFVRVRVCVCVCVCRGATRNIWAAVQLLWAHAAEVPQPPTLTAAHTLSHIVTHVQAVLPRAKGEPLPEGLLWLLLTGDVPTPEQVRAKGTN